MKIINKIPLGQHRLRAHARAAGFNIVGADFRHQLLQRARELRLRKRAPDFIAAHARIFCEKSPKPRKEKRVRQITRIDGRPLVAFTRKRQHRVWPRFDAAVDQPREMHAEKWKLRVRHRINQMPHQKLPLLFDLIILAAKGNDFCGRFLPGGAHQPVGVQSATGDDELRLKITGGSLHCPIRRILRGLLQLGVEPDFTARPAD